MAKTATKKVEKVQEESVEDVLDNMTDDEIEALAAEIEAGDADEDETVEEAVDQDDVDSTKGMDANYKTNRLSVAMKTLAGMENWQIDHFLKSLEQIGHEADAIPGGASAQNQASVAMKGSPAPITGISSSGITESLKASLKEDLASVFGDDKDLTEEFKEKIATLFEAAVGYRVSATEAQIAEQYEARFEEEVGALTESLIEKVDEYVSYVAEEWLKENEVAVQHALTTEIAEDFITDLKALFTAHNIEVPQDKVDLVQAQDDKIRDLEEQLNQTIEDNMMLSEVVKTSERDNLVSEFTTGMTLSQTEKFKQLIENVDYDGDAEAFANKMEIVKNSHFKGGKNGKTPSTNIITEEITYSPADAVDKGPEEPLPADPAMRNYVLGLSRTIRH